MTDKQIINLKPMEDLNKKIIKEKGNTKCIFYSDDICRNGDKTRDCVNCARVEYHSLYSLNWDNQERLQKIIKQKEQELQQAMDNYVQLDLQRVKEYNELVDLYKSKEQECEELKTMLKDLSYENQKFCYQIEEQTKQLKPFKDEYFKGLDNVAIAELAKKSIRITSENSKLEQTLTEIKEIAKEQMPYMNIAEAKTMIEIEYDYAGNIYNLGQRMDKILQKISECEVENERN